MSNYSIYFSPTGGTKKVTDILVNTLASDWQEIDLCREVAPMNLTAEDMCLVSVPSYGGRVPGIALKRLAAIKANGAKAVLVCVYGIGNGKIPSPSCRTRWNVVVLSVLQRLQQWQSALSSASTPQAVRMQTTQQSLPGLPNRFRRS